MKLDIEAMAGQVQGRQRGTSLSDVDEIEAFARLIVERCAQECESRQTPGTASVAILNGAADAIRNLLED